MINNPIAGHEMEIDLSPITAHPKTECMDCYAKAPDDIKNYLFSIEPVTGARDFCWVNSGSSDEVHHVCSNNSGIVNLYRLNEIRHLNPFLERMNQKIPDGSFYIVCLEAKNQRKKRILSKFPRGVNTLYYTLDFLLKRVMPKLKLTRVIYFKLTKGRNRVMTCTEALGRLVCCGFSILDTCEIGYQTFIVARKTGSPTFDRQPTYGALCKLRRVGKDGNVFTVYKLRTMHPYSEYLQKFMVENNNLKKGGKINNDFRITSWGHLLRKFWIDELPMFWNWFKREMKLVGVRPLSVHYYNLYPEEIRRLREKVRPGLIPPYYADLPETFEEIVESERKYIEAYLQQPIRTDVRYFFRVAYNILFKMARSQ